MPDQQGRIKEGRPPGGDGSRLEPPTVEQHYGVQMLQLGRGRVGLRGLRHDALGAGRVL